MGRKKKHAKSNKQATEATPACKYSIIGKFIFNGVAYNAGEKLPPFIPKAEKEDLWRQGKLARFDAGGNREVYRLPRKLSENDMLAVLANPYLLPEWFGKFAIEIESLKILKAKFEALNMDSYYIGLIEKEIINNGKKEEGAGADRFLLPPDGVKPCGEGTGDEVSQG